MLQLWTCIRYFIGTNFIQSGAWQPRARSHSGRSALVGGDHTSSTIESMAYSRDHHTRRLTARGTLPAAKMLTSEHCAAAGTATSVARCAVTAGGMNPR